MPVVVTGSIATDHLMTFPGKFTEQFVEGQMENVSLSFLVDDLVQHRGGAGANMAYGLGLLGLRPVLVGAVGNDFADYDAWLTRHGVDTASVHWSEMKHTALMRISSLSKPFTAVAILQFIEKGKLKLDDKIVDVLKLRAGGTKPDERWKKITIRNLLEHRGGWDHSSKKKTDPTFASLVCRCWSFVSSTHSSIGHAISGNPGTK